MAAVQVVSVAAFNEPLRLRLRLRLRSIGAPADRLQNAVPSSSGAFRQKPVNVWHRCLPSTRGLELCVRGLPEQQRLAAQYAPQHQDLALWQDWQDKCE